MLICEKINLPVSELYVEVDYIYFINQDKFSLPQAIYFPTSALVDDGGKGSEVVCGECTKCDEDIKIVSYCPSLVRLLRDRFAPIWRKTDVCKNCGEKLVALRVSSELVVHVEEREVVSLSVSICCPFCGTILDTNRMYEKLNRE